MGWRSASGWPKQGWQRKAAGVVGPAVTLDPAFLAPDGLTVLSNGNLTVERQTSASHTVARGTKAIPAGGAYWAARPDVYTSAGAAAIGIVDSTVATTLGSLFLGDTVHECGVFMNPAFYYNGAATNIDFTGVIPVGTWMLFALIGGVLHVNIAGRGWDVAGGGTISPNTGGQAVASIGATIYPAWGMNNVGDKTTFNFGATAFDASLAAAVTDCVNAGLLSLQNA